jgi:hypothetical protein
MFGIEMLAFVIVADAEEKEQEQAECFVQPSA